MEDFVCILRCLTFTDIFPEFNIHLRLGAPGSDSLALKDQEAILSPFEKLVGEGQRCKVTGIVDNTLAQRVVLSATPTIFWSRAQCRDFWDIVEHHMRIADTAASKRQFDVTHHIYDKIQRCMEAPGKIGKVMSQFVMCEDRALSLSFSLMQSRPQHGLMLANLWKSSEQQTCDQARPFFDDIIEMGTHTYNPHTVWHRTAHWEQIHAMTYVGLGKYKLAQNRFMKAMKIDPSEMTYTTSYNKCGETQEQKGDTT